MDANNLTRVSLEDGGGFWAITMMAPGELEPRVQAVAFPEGAHPQTAVLVVRLKIGADDVGTMQARLGDTISFPPDSFVSGYLQFEADYGSRNPDGSWTVPLPLR